MAGDMRRAIKNMWLQIGAQAAPQQVVRALEKIGIEVSESFVIKVRDRMLRDEATAMRERCKRPPVSKVRKRPQQRKRPGGGRGR